MSSISRRRNGLMALSVIGGSCLALGLQPLDLKTGRLLLLLPETLPLPHITARAVYAIGKFTPLWGSRNGRAKSDGSGPIEAVGFFSARPNPESLAVGRYYRKL